MHLAGLEIVDGHCRAIDLGETQSCKPMGFAAGTLAAALARHRLSAFLGCSDNDTAVVEARRRALAVNGPRYFSGLLRAAGITTLIADAGPGDGAGGDASIANRDDQPTDVVWHDRFAAQAGVPVAFLARVDDLAAQHSGRRFYAFLDGVLEGMERALADPRTVGLGATVGSPAGATIGHPSSQEAKAAYDRQLEGRMPAEDEHAGDVSDYLLCRAVEQLRERGGALQLHLCAEAPAARGAFCGPPPRPYALRPFLAQLTDLPVVIMHAGFPSVDETAQLAAGLAHVHVDLSGIALHAPGQLERTLESLVGRLPADRILFGSGMRETPEEAWLAAVTLRSALERVLRHYVDYDYLSQDEARQTAVLILAENARRVYSLA